MVLKGPWCALFLLLYLVVCLSVEIKGVEWSGLSFVREPEDIVVRKLAPAWMDCLVKGDPTPSVTWLRDDAPLRLEKDSRRQVLRNGTLFFKVVFSRKSEATDAGLYQCVASSEAGTVVSTQARLRVLGLPKFDEQPQNISVFERERAYFPCAISASPPPTVSWYKNSHLLKIDSRMTVLPSGSLEIENVEMSDQGLYYCMAVSIDKTKISQNAYLNVKQAFALRNPTPPSFIAKPKTLKALIGTNVTLDCAANGYPEPSVVWLKDGSTIDMQNLDSRFIFYGSTKALQVTSLEEKDAGTYMCRAENKLDSKDAVAQIQVLVAPKFRKRPENTIGYEKEDVELSCSVYSKPSPTVRWLKNGELIKESQYFKIVNRHSLKILGLVANDAGMYQCMGSNMAGQIQAAAELKVLKRSLNVTLPADIPTSTIGVEEGDTSSGHPVPSAPRHLEAIVTSNRFVTLSWHEPEFNSEHIIGYSVYYHEVNSDRVRMQYVSASSSGNGLDEYKTQINHLTPASSYLVRVVAQTESGGTGEYSEEIRVMTRPDLNLPLSPRNLTVAPISPRSLSVMWLPPIEAIPPIEGYIVYYMKVGSAEEHEIETSETNYELKNLDEYTEYSIWLVALNKNGQSDPTHEVTAHTYSDMPSGEPQNFTVEAGSSNSLILRWEPPAPEHQNGVIVGYKIRYKELNGQQSTTKTTDGNRRLFLLQGLKKSMTYQIKLSAMTVNGSGPPTNWVQQMTFSNDLDENRVPAKPSGLRAMASSNTIHIRWQAPSGDNVMVRGYTIGWGKGFPDVRSKIVDSKQRNYIISDLEANSEYVISLRAFNSEGDGQPVYEQVRTRPPVEKAMPTLTPPVGLKTEVLTPYTISLQWTDTTLNRNQFIGDRGYYTVRYTTHISATSSSPRYKYINASDVTCLVDGLKPATVYEFAVKAIKGRRSSPWSLVAMNTTLTARPSSPPRDVSVVTVVDDPSTVIFSWQPPRQANGKITGYLIFYTDNVNSDWALEEVNGDRVTQSLQGLTPSTIYYYKVQGRNSKGFGPFSPVANFSTLSGVSPSKAEPPVWFSGHGGLVMIVVAGIAGTLLVVGAMIALAIYFRKSKLKSRNSANNVGKNKRMEVNPPDLWFHHDQLELKNMDKNDRSSSPSHMTVINHAGDHLGGDETDKLLKRRSFKPKPLIISMDLNKDPVVGGSTSSSVYSDGTIGRTGYILPQYPVPSSQGYSSPSENPYSPNPTSSLFGFSALPSYDAVVPPPNSQPLPSSMVVSGSISSAAHSSSLSGEGSSTLGKRGSNPLRSFSVPAPPQSAPTTPQPKHMMGVRPPQGSTSPFKKPLNTTVPPGLIGRRVLPSGRVEVLLEQEEVNEALLHGYSTEELTQEMANLEGLMKDLSAIAANQFNC